MPTAEPSRQLVARLRAGQPVVALTGAGVSAESGLATFRGPGGLWRGRSPLELATPEAFAADPLEVWRFYAWRRTQASNARPNPAHLALAALERERPGFLLVSQNVDGLHERAGSRGIVRLHGTLWRLRCVAERREFDDRRADLGPLPPRCACGALLRPAVVWFGEPLPQEALERALAAVRAAGVVLVAGTSGAVYPAAWLPRIARESGAHVVEINPETTPFSAEADERIAAPAGQALPRLVAAAGIRCEAAS